MHSRRGGVHVFAGEIIWSARRAAAAWGAHAAGVQFSAARRKPRSTNFFVRRRKLELGHDGLGEPPKPARGPRALPVSISEIGLIALRWHRSDDPFAAVDVDEDQLDAGGRFAQQEITR